MFPVRFFAVRSSRFLANLDATFFPSPCSELHIRHCIALHRLPLLRVRFPFRLPTFAGRSGPCASATLYVHFLLIILLIMLHSRDVNWTERFRCRSVPSRGRHSSANRHDPRARSLSVYPEAFAHHTVFCHADLLQRVLGNFGPRRRPAFDHLLGCKFFFVFVLSYVYLFYFYCIDRARAPAGCAVPSFFVCASEIPFQPTLPSGVW